MIIDAVTLPKTEAGATIEEGQQFIITGYNFEFWPDQIVLGYTEENVRSTEVLNRYLILTEKTSNTLVFSAQITGTYNIELNWNIFGSPSSPPRTILEYSTI